MFRWQVGNLCECSLRKQSYNASGNLGRVCSLSKTNIIVKRFLSCFLAISLGGLCSGQTTPQYSTQLTHQRAEATLHQLPEDIKNMDEAGFRVFLRYKIASYLWARGFKEEFAFAQAMVEDAIEDLCLHKGDIKDSDSNYYEDKLLALLRTHSPALATKLTEKYELNKNERDNFGIAYSMLNTKDGITRAVEMVSRSLKNGRDGGLTLLVFLTNLVKEDRR